MEKIDFVITYLDNTDKNWQNNYKIYSRIEKKKYDPNNVRFRSWGNFKYVLRSIGKNLPFINNLFIIVSSEEQIPEYINKNNVKIIYHKDIIPEEYLPTFNSNTIELFLYNIKELSENFIYSNDDIFITNEMTANEFFDENMNPKIQVVEKRVTDKNVYISTLRKTQKLANKENKDFKLQSALSLLRSNHSMNPMKKSIWEYYWNKYSKYISSNITRFRDAKNITQELSNYHLFMNYTINNINAFGTRHSKYFNFIKKTTEDLTHFINDKNITSICINDYGVIDFNIYKKEVNKILEKKYPNKCKYET